MSSNAIETTHPADLLDNATRAVVEAVLGESAPTNKEALTAMLQANRELMTSGDSRAMAAALSRQGVALEMAMNGLLVVMAKTAAPEGRLDLARAAAVLHAACLRSLSALHQINKDARLAAPAT